MTKRRRWIMSGPWKHPNGIYHYRKKTPTDICRRKADLNALGIEVRGEIKLSLHTRDYKKACHEYRKKADEWESNWGNWRTLLTDGSQRLDIESMAAIAGSAARTYFETYKRFPEDVLKPEHLFSFVFSWLRTLEQPMLYMGDPIEDFVDELAKVPFVSLLSYLDAALIGAGWWRKRNIQIMQRALFGYESLQGSRGANELAKSLGVLPDASSLKRLDELGARFFKDANLSLSARLDGDVREPKWLEEFPSLDKIEALIDPYDSWTFESIISEQVDRDRRALKKKKADSTIRRYRRDTRYFADFCGKICCRDITIKDAEEWRYKLIEDRQAPKTIREKLRAVQSVISWGQKQSGFQLFPTGSPLRGLELPDIPDVDPERKTYTLEQARKILTACRHQSKPWLRWVPWLCAYTGMRVSEAIRLEKSDFFQYKGNWFVEISAANKNRKLRRLPLLGELLEEGIIEFTEKLPNGRLFKDRDIGYVREWIRKEIIPLSDDVPDPTHGFRHLHQDLCGLSVSLAALAYIRNGKSDEDGYGSSKILLPKLYQDASKMESIWSDDDADY